MDTESLAKDLEDIVNSFDFSVIPYQKGNSIRIKNFVIRKTKHGYSIYDCSVNKPVTKTYFKYSAIAIVKKLVQGKDIVSSIQELDRKMLKYYNDAIFYKDTIRRTDDPTVRETRQIRLSLAVDETNRIRQHLEDFIFD
jgi:hypothetical protein